MSDYGLFWNSQNGDRVYNADSMEEWLKPFFVTGVFNGELQVIADEGMKISVMPGYCNINGKVRYFNSQTFTIETANGVTDRIDTVVIERNDADRIIYVKVVTGDSSGAPTPPIRDNGIYQLVIAQIVVEADTIEITQSSIIDTRTDSYLCGYVCSTVKEIDFDQLVIQYKQFFLELRAKYMNDWINWSDETKEIYEAWITDTENEFNAWFDHIRDQLDTDVAGHLQNEIDDISNRLSEFARTGELTDRIQDETYQTITDENDDPILGSSVFVPYYVYEGGNG